MLCKNPRKSFHSDEWNISLVEYKVSGISDFIRVTSGILIDLYFAMGIFFQPEKLVG